MLDPDRIPPKDDKGIGANIVAAVLLTVLAIPVLFLATCVPAGFVIAGMPDPRLGIGVLLTGAIVLCAALAYHADMPGKRIGFIAAAIEIAALGAYLLIYLH